MPVEISRTGYTGDLGYEVWIPAEHAEAVWDALMKQGERYDITPTGILALDVARIEAGLILLDVDYVSARKALIPSPALLALRDRPGPAGAGGQGPASSARARCAASKEPARRASSAAWTWTGTTSTACTRRWALPPQIASTASRVSVPVYDGGRQVGRATSTTWSPTLKKMIALSSLAAQSAAPGTRLEMEYTVEHQRRRVGVTVHARSRSSTPRAREAEPLTS